MSSNTMRQLHRWLSLAFAVSVFGNIGCLVAGSQAQWIGLLALLPLIPLLFTGLYLFALPYVARTRRA